MTDRIRLLPLLAPWLRPAAWAPRTDRVPLRLAFLIHVLAGIGVLVAGLSIDPFSDWLRDNDFSFLHLWAESASRFVRVFERHTAEAILFTAVMVVLTEISCVVIALLVMLWGAAGEPLRTSFAHALRRVWLHTTQVVPLFILGGVPITYMEHLCWMFRRSAYSLPGPRDWNTFPWWVRYEEVIIGYVAVAVSLWFLWALFRAAGVPRRDSEPDRPPTCEYCGYNLTGTAIEGRCPECGVPAVLSLGPDVRRGTAYDRAPKGGFSVMQGCWLDAVFCPKTIGRQIQVTQPSRRYRRCLTAILVPALAVSAIGFFMAMFAAERGRLDANEIVEILLLVPLMAVCCPAAAVLLAMLMASVGGTFLSVQDKRNLLPAAVQMQCSLGGFLLLWQTFGWIWGTIAVSLDNAGLFRYLEEVLLLDDDIMAFLFWFLPTAGLLFLDGILVWKGTSAARYANR